MTLVYDLIWTNAKTLTPPKDLPVFLTALEEIKETLSTWIPRKQQVIQPSKQAVQQQAMQTENFSNQEDSETHQPSDYISYKEQYLPDGNSEEEWDSDDGERASEEYDSDSITNKNSATCNENVLFFVLQEKYEETNLLFHRLRGRDGDLARLLQNCTFLEVHLAMVALKKSTKQRVDTEYETCRQRRHGRCSYCDGDEMIHRSVKISRWIDSANTIKDLKIILNWKEQCIGPFRNLLTSRGIKPDLEEIEHMECGAEAMNSWYYNGILVIRPKYQAMLVYDENDIHPLLDRMENLLSSASSVLKEDDHRNITSDLQQVIAFYNKPQKNFRTDKKNRSDLMARLFRVVIVLRSRENGLVLLKILGDKEGIQSTEVAKAIAEFECKVTGKF